MQTVMIRMKQEWSTWMVVAFFALLPFGRSPELPLSILALSLPFLLRSADNRRKARAVAVPLISLFLCFWLPMVLSSFDSYLPEKSSMRSLAALRYLAAAFTIAITLHRPSRRWRVLKWTSFLLLFWAMDGFVQLFFGADIFGVVMHPDRLNALFIRQYQFYGPTLAILSPFLLEYARRQWSSWAWIVSFSLILGAVMIAGMRSGWLIMGLVMGVYFLLMLSRENRQLRFASLAIPVMAAAVIVGGYFVSPLLQERIEQSLTALEGTGTAVDFASSKRLPIFDAAISMYQAHPVNGVGVRAFPEAYLSFAAADDVHVIKNAGSRGALHAHNVVLEVMSDTGTIGLIGLLAAAWLVYSCWRKMRPTQRLESFPYLLAMLLVLFPLNSHFAIFGTYLSSLLWVLADTSV